MNTPKVATEVAVQDFERFIDLNAIDADEKTMNAEEKADFAKAKGALVRRISEGSLVIGDEGQAIYTPVKSKNKEAITFSEPSGAALLAMDRKKKGEDAGKLYGAMGELAHVDPKVFALMHLSDAKVCITIATLFLA